MGKRKSSASDSNDTAPCMTRKEIAVVDSDNCILTWGHPEFCWLCHARYQDGSMFFTDVNKYITKVMQTSHTVDNATDAVITVLNKMKTEMLKAKPEMANEIQNIKFDKKVIQQCLAKSNVFKKKRMLRNLETLINDYTFEKNPTEKRLRCVCKAYETYFKLADMA
tara:strand:+ start:160 stop:657 length:498 start_codon:yes stop_codon:yes gene_type:complete